MAQENAQGAGPRTGWKAGLAVIDGWRPGASPSQQGSAHLGPGLHPLAWGDYRLALIPGLAGAF
jgi:hypothetical protein